MPAGTWHQLSAVCSGKVAMQRGVRQGRGILLVRPGMEGDCTPARSTRTFLLPLPCSHLAARPASCLRLRLVAPGALHDHARLGADPRHD